MLDERIAPFLPQKLDGRAVNLNAVTLRSLSALPMKPRYSVKEFADIATETRNRDDPYAAAPPYDHARDCQHIVASSVRQ